MDPATAPAPEELAELVDELRVLARSRSVLQFTETPAPVLDAIVDAQGLRLPDGRQQLLDEAIGAIAYPQYQESARLLLGSHVDRWQTLTRRGELAAEQFGISYDGFRRARTTSPSLLDETLEILARAISRQAEGPAAGTPDTTPPWSEVVAPADPVMAAGAADDPDAASALRPDDATQLDLASQTDEPGDGTRPREGTQLRRRPLIVVGAAAALVLVILVAAVLANRSGDTDEAAAPPVDAASASSASAPSCDTLVPDGLDEPELAAYAEVFTEEAAAVVEDPANGCPTGGLQRWDAFVFEQFVVDGTNTGVLASTDPAEAIWFTDAQWGSYHQVGGKSGDNAQELMGIAKAPEQRDGYIVIPTDTDAILVGETPQSPHFFLLGPARTAWEDEGGSAGPLGLPTSNPVVIGGALSQDFTGGYLEQLPDASVVPHLVPDPGAELPPLRQLHGKIVRHADATSWYVGTDGLRYWIPNGEVWTCLGGESALADIEIRGYAIATLPYAGPATC